MVLAQPKRRARGKASVSTARGTFCDCPASLEIPTTWVLTFKIAVEQAYPHPRALYRPRLASRLQYRLQASGSRLQALAGIWHLLWGLLDAGLRSQSMCVRAHAFSLGMHRIQARNNAWALMLLAHGLIP